jgi:hypothetical protein
VKSEVQLEKLALRVRFGGHNPEKESWPTMAALHMPRWEGKTLPT